MLEIAAILQFLSPAVPFLVGAATQVAGGSAEAIGGDVWKSIKSKLGQKLENDPNAQPTIAKMKLEPNNKEFQKILESVLKEILEKDNSLREEISQTLEKNNAQVQIQVSATGGTTQTIGIMGPGSKAIGVVHGDAHM